MQYGAPASGQARKLVVRVEVQVMLKRLVLEEGAKRLVLEEAAKQLVLEEAAKRRKPIAPGVSPG